MKGRNSRMRRMRRKMKSRTRRGRMMSRIG